MAGPGLLDVLALGGSSRSPFELINEFLAGTGGPQPHTPDYEGAAEGRPHPDEMAWMRVLGLRRVCRFWAFGCAIVEQLAGWAAARRAAEAAARP